MQKRGNKVSWARPHLTPGIIGLVLCLIVGVGIVLSRQSAVRQFRDKVIQHAPFGLPGLPVCPDCNVILVSLDTLRADDLPCYGYTRNTAPNLCAFAKANIQFSRMYSESSNTLDGHMSVFTGLYPSTHHMIYQFTDVLNPAIKTLTEVLASHGYKTIYGGAIDDSNLPISLGLGRGFSEIHEMKSRKPGWQNDYKHLLSELAGERPTFLFLHTYAVHDPYIAGHKDRSYVPGSIPGLALTPEEFHTSSWEYYQFILDDYRTRLAASDNSVSVTRAKSIIANLESAIATREVADAKDVEASLSPDEQYRYMSNWYWSHVDKKNPDQINYLQGLYDERIRTLDTDLAPLLAYVSRPEIKRRTILIVMSDHGEEFMEHGQVQHGINLYNFVTHVPSIMAIPRVPGGRIDALAQNIDLYPTILSLVGVRPENPIDGKSLVPLIMHTTTSVNPYVVSEQRSDITRSIQDGIWKLYVKKNEDNGLVAYELYNLKADPTEKQNIVSIRLDVKMRLLQALNNTLSKSPHFVPITAEFPSWIDRKIRDELTETGYF